MPLFSRSFQDLMVDSIGDLSQNTNISRLSPGGMARAILESINKRVAEAYDTFDLNLARAFVSAAPGQYLELIGLLLGVSRGISYSATVDSNTEIIKMYVATGTFGDINNGNDIVIPQGTLLSTEPNNAGVMFRVTEEATLVAGASAAWISAEAAIPGEDSNVGDRSLVYHDFINYTDYTNETLLVTNIHPVANGKNFESDDNYRYRIVNRVLEAEAANLTALRLAILSTAGVADAIIIRRYRGIGTVGVILKSTIPVVSQTLIDNVTANVLAVQSFGDIVYVRKPKESGISLKTNIVYNSVMIEDELLMIEETLTNIIKTHINSLDIGEEFVVNRLVAELFGASQSIANIGIAGKPIEELYIHLESKLADNKVRQLLLGDYSPAEDERVIMEPSLDNPIILTRSFKRR